MWIFVFPLRVPSFRVLRLRSMVRKPPHMVAKGDEGPATRMSSVIFLLRLPCVGRRGVWAQYIQKVVSPWIAPVHVVASCRSSGSRLPLLFSEINDCSAF